MKPHRPCPSSTRRGSWLATALVLASPACHHNPDHSPTEICDNHVDDDGDGLVDCLDDDCLDDAACLPCNRDGVCQSDESAGTCPQDCAPVCGDGRCDAVENAAACPQDCDAVCPNGHCEPGEDGLSCPADCGAGDCTTFPDLVSQQTCDASEACDLLDAQNHVGCRDAGDTAHYAPCTAATDCLAGDSCISLDGQHAFCAPFCDPDSDVCPDDGQCYITIPGITGASLCGLVTLDDCDLVTSDGCATNEACYQADAEGGTLCTTPGTRDVGTTCEYANDCRTGLGCYGSAGIYQCVAQCHETTDCDAGTCQRIGQVVPGHDDVGLCQ